jgi:chromosome segregation ATPase
MTDHSDIAQVQDSQSDQDGDPAKAFLCLFQSAQNFLKYQAIIEEGIKAKIELEKKEAEIVRQNQKINELNTAISVWVREGNKEVTRMRVEKAIILKRKEELDTKLKQALKDNTEAKQEAEKKNTELNERLETFTQAQKEVEKLKTGLQCETAKAEDLTTKLAAARDELKYYDACISNIVEIDLKKLYSIFL